MISTRTKRLLTVKRLLGLLPGILCLAACAPCYMVKMKVPAGSGVTAAIVDYQDVSIRDMVPHQAVCEAVPETVRIRYFTDHTGQHQFAKEPIYVKKYMPKGFLDNPMRMIKFTVDQNGATQVLFQMQLSDITTKFVAHTETEAEKKQRLADERLWISIAKKELNGVHQALDEGAVTTQPWMHEAYWHLSDQATQYVIYEAAMNSRHPDILDAVLKAGAKRFDETHITNLWFPFAHSPSQADGSSHTYVGNDLAEVLLRHGANPNAGLKLRFPWNTTDWRSRPDMPKYADLEPPPVDRLLYLATKENNAGLVRLLLQNGAETKFRLPASREPPTWWRDGEWFLDWVRREASEPIQQLLLQPSKDG